MRYHHEAALGQDELLLFSSLIFAVVAPSRTVAEVFPANSSDSAFADQANKNDTGKAISFLLIIAANYRNYFASGNIGSLRRSDNAALGCAMFLVVSMHSKGRASLPVGHPPPNPIRSDSTCLPVYGS